MTEKILIIGSGGREHAIYWALSECPEVSSICVIPGNGGITNPCDAVGIHDVDINYHETVIDFCKSNDITYAVVSPDDNLAAGMVDALTDAGIPCFGPTQAASKIEWSKSYAKEFMIRHGIPTAKFGVFTDQKDACDHITTVAYKAHVIKADGLAAGKGVIVAQSEQMAINAVKDMLEHKRFKKSGETIIIEELLQGEEVSVFCVSDGEHIQMLPTCKDFKRLNDGDEGPNTGGMGAFSPYPLLDDTTLEYIKVEIMQKVIDGLRAEGAPYKGVLYGGLMLTSEGVSVLEFNSRFGDPEAEVILPQLKSNVFEMLSACTEGRLHEIPPLEWCRNSFTASVCVVSGGYPYTFAKGTKIGDIDENVFNEAKGNYLFHAGTAIHPDTGDLITSGGRVLHCVARRHNLQEAVNDAKGLAASIRFQGAFYRTDIGKETVRKMRKCSPCGSQYPLTYEQSGVHVALGNAFVHDIAELCRATARLGTSASIGGFGGFFDLRAAGYTDPILVTSTDGVGTKLEIAQAVGDHSAIGIDLVAMCVNDIVVHGAEPLCFLDYFATGLLDRSSAESVVRGIADGCKMAGCALVGGETAEMPGFYAQGRYDLAGFVLGAKERTAPVLPDVNNIHVGDVVLGVASSGLHSNGFSLVRKIIHLAGLEYTSPCPWDCSQHLGQVLLTPTRIYIKSVLPILRSSASTIKAVAHITGGGLVENIPRVLPNNVSCVIDTSSWDIPQVFGWLSAVGNVEAEEMFRTFNCGLGLVIIVGSAGAAAVQEALSKAGEVVSKIGVIEERTCQDGNQVIIKNHGSTFELKDFARKISVPMRKISVTMRNGASTFNGVTKKTRVAVLISGTGSNLQSLIDHTLCSSTHSICEISLVVSNCPNAYGLIRAKHASIPTLVLDSKDKSLYPDRTAYDSALNKLLQDESIDIVCLAGFMRILTESFCTNWEGRLLNIHPSLLPSFKGAHAIRDAITNGVRISGCTVHFAVADVDSGAIIQQEAVPVGVTDSEHSLLEKIHIAEHKIYPQALEKVARGEVYFEAEHNKAVWKL